MPANPPGQLGNTRWSQIGEVQLDTVTLLNPEFRLGSLYYNPSERLAIIELMFRESGALYEHVQAYSFELSENNEQITPALILGFIEEQFPEADRNPKE